jgi:hypothetical protein
MDNLIQKYDRTYGSIVDVSLTTKPSTIKLVQPVTGRSETFIIQTARHEDSGDYIFVECADENGLVRLALPPKVANAIAAQREALSKRRRSIASRAVMRERMAQGHVPTFKKKTKSK